jgi:4-hydroxy-2-oxoheptanedioate aldolase
MVNSPEEAERAVGACRYAPDGYRSWGPVRAALGVPGYSRESANRRTVVAVMIETRAGVEAADEILAVPGVDAVYVGPNDLAISLGLQPSADPREAEHVAAIEKILGAAQRHGVTPGIHCGSAETAERWRDAGFRMLNVNSDAVFLRSAARAVAERLGARLEPAERSTGGYS